RGEQDVADGRSCRLVAGVGATLVEVDKRPVATFRRGERNGEQSGKSQEDNGKLDGAPAIPIARKRRSLPGKPAPPGNRIARIDRQGADDRDQRGAIETGTRHHVVNVGVDVGDELRRGPYDKKDQHPHDNDVDGLEDVKAPLKYSD